MSQAAGIYVAGRRTPLYRELLVDGAGDWLPAGVPYAGFSAGRRGRGDVRDRRRLADRRPGGVLPRCRRGPRPGRAASGPRAHAVRRRRPRDVVGHADAARARRLPRSGGRRLGGRRAHVPGGHAEATSSCTEPGARTASSLMPSGVSRAARRPCIRLRARRPLQRRRSNSRPVLPIGVVSRSPAARAPPPRTESHPWHRPQTPPHCAPQTRPPMPRAGTTKATVAA